MEKENKQQKEYFVKNKRSLLSDYLQMELEKNERVVLENEHFVVVVPYWATWPFETLLISKRQVQNILQFKTEEKMALGEMLKKLTVRYDNLFSTSFPYSQGIHQAPVNDGDHPEWHWHMHFYPPLLRSATVKKYMVGYELLANPQRDITPEVAAQTLRNLSDIHF
jgi:UDPglucose--hexose-1-phosphate uridylyltransferase